MSYVDTFTLDLYYDVPGGKERRGDGCLDDQLIVAEVDEPWLARTTSIGQGYLPLWGTVDGYMVPAPMGARGPTHSRAATVHRRFGAPIRSSAAVYNVAWRKGGDVCFYWDHDSRAFCGHPSLPGRTGCMKHADRIATPYPVQHAGLPSRDIHWLPEGRVTQSELMYSRASHRPVAPAAKPARIVDLKSRPTEPLRFNPDDFVPFAMPPLAVYNAWRRNYTALAQHIGLRASGDGALVFPACVATQIAESPITLPSFPIGDALDIYNALRDGNYIGFTVDLITRTTRHLFCGVVDPYEKQVVFVDTTAHDWRLKGPLLPLGWSYQLLLWPLQHDAPKDSVQEKGCALIGGVYLYYLLSLPHGKRDLFDDLTHLAHALQERNFAPLRQLDGGLSEKGIPLSLRAFPSDELSGDRMGGAQTHHQVVTLATILEMLEGRVPVDRLSADADVVTLDP